MKTASAAGSSHTAMLSASKKSTRKLRIICRHIHHRSQARQQQRQMISRIIYAACGMPQMTSGGRS